MPKQTEKQRGAGGAPSQYSKTILSKAKEYLDQWEELGDYIPQLCGLSEHCQICETTRQKYEKEHEEFAAVCARVRARQQRVLINKGLSRQADASLSKLLLMKHGYSDRVETDIKSSDGSMSPPKPMTEDELKEKLRAKGIEC